MFWKVSIDDFENVSVSFGMMIQGSFIFSLGNRLITFRFVLLLFAAKFMESLGGEAEIPKVGVI